KKRNIVYRISRFNGDNLYYDGWIDFTDHSIKWNTVEERDSNASKCMQRVGKYFIINEGEIHCCSRGFWRSYNNIIPKIKGEYVDLLNDDISVEEKQKDLRTMISLTS
ncbi:MAG TPA: radical SAM protein, partial [Terrisporobacter glycolicus]|nr:radical SAM protein [Terrisporobacter hibernicus]